MGIFKTGFSIEDYKHKGILYPWREYIKEDKIINIDQWEAGDFDLCVWKRQEEPLVITQEFIHREVRRILRTGVYICIKEEVLWIPPNYYLFLQYFNVGGAPAQFRLKRLKHVYYKIEVRNKPLAKGTYTIKNRQDGETTMAMSDCLWEVADGNMDYGNIGMQSKTRDTVQNSCWRTLLLGWNGLPEWLRHTIYDDFASGDKVAEKMKFVRQKSKGDNGRDIMLLYGASTHNAFDSMNNMRRCVLDEINKWLECSFYDTFLNYEKFILAGVNRKGLFDIFSSPADTNGKHNDEAYAFWQKSDPSKLDEFGNTESGVWRYYSNPLDGIEGMYDKFGDADPDEILDRIKKKRKSVPADKQMGEVRAYPLNEEEMFGSFDSSGLWSNTDGIKSRVFFLTGRRFKDPVTKEPVKIYGNLERVDGYIDGEVEFRPVDIDHFDVRNARFCFSYLPKNKETLTNIFTPPAYIENSLGVDPFNKRYTKHKRKSNGAIVNWKFRDLYSTGVNRCPTMIYSNRTQHEATFYEDVLKAAIFNRARIQYENVTAGLGEYIEDRGYHAWLLPSRGEKEGSKLTGDSPSGKGGFLNEGIGLLNAALNTPLNEDEPYLLELQWFIELLEDNMKFNPLDTHENDLTMAELQALLGAVKTLHTKQRKPSRLNAGVMSYLLG